jgi:hypothetical protein
MTLSSHDEDSLQPSNVIGHWLHSHEEDDPSYLVFRPSSYAFPPSRGRRELHLDENGRILERSPGPDDRRVTVTGTWTLRGNVLDLSTEGRPTESLRIIGADNGRLLIER